MFLLLSSWTDAFSNACQRFLVQRNDGGATSVYVAGDGTKPMFLVFEKKIGRNDVVDGKLLPVVEEKVKRRGGKRHTTICVSHEGAEALYKALKPALKEMKRRRRTRMFAGRIFVAFEHMIRADSRTD